MVRPRADECVGDSAARRNIFERLLRFVAAAVGLGGGGLEFGGQPQPIRLDAFHRFAHRLAWEPARASQLGQIDVEL